ncbi:hypothetical protein SAMN05421823_102339 [Catalinimonas alkaloidigena]|uniref:TIGR01777 family protein n=1 Tax=Catalinimonas alkaloidigena TaxID=1075417 RepID=A0A1G9AL33_9BACT|nr:TIGR01777 family oxidoreductase [Catalinimonas alkaloidigena]SDK28052.1 hypothetical protein SAMN05421823_102339 [Catalinimonas alkaloidigena]
MNTHPTLVLAGGSGFLGQLLTRHFAAQGYRIVILSRHAAQPSSSQVHYYAWDGHTPGPWQQALEGAAALINLTGKSVNCRYTPANRQEIVRSRVASTQVLGEAIRACQHPPKVWINAGSAAIYGNAGVQLMDEFSATGEGFSADVCRAWEEAFEQQTTPHTRKVMLRLGLVLSPEGGVLPPFLKLVQARLGGRIGHGDQYLSWLHADDFVRMVQYVMQHEELTGIFNATGPEPVRNHQWMRTLRQVTRHRFGLPTPAWLARLGTTLAGTEAELLLQGRRAIPARLLRSGFQFRHPYLEEALCHLLRVSPPEPVSFFAPVLPSRTASS